MAEGFGQYKNTSSTARIKELKKKVRAANTKDPEDLMLIIIDVFREEVLVPEPGNLYTFIYNPKTPNIDYDQHPLIACTDLQKWGFRGINFHWEKQRQYTSGEIIGPLHIVNQNEVGDLRRIPFGRIKINN